MERVKIEALCSGDHKAFEAIFIAYFQRIEIFINGIIKSDGDAQELAQDVFVKLWTTRDQIDPAKSLNAYIYTIARNNAFNFLKHKTVKQSYLDDYQLPNGGDTPEEICFAREIGLLVDMTVSQMPVRRQRIYTMSRSEGISNDDIAVQLNISRKTVDNQISIALREIRKVVTSFFLLFF